MPNFEGAIKFEEDFSDERLIGIDEEIKELKEAQFEAVDSIKLESKKKKKQKKSDMQTIELPANPETRDIEFVKDAKGRFHFEFTDNKDNVIVASPGDLVADMQWGIYYDLNHEVISSDHRSKYDKFRKEYLSAAYQVKIDKLETEKLLILRLQDPQLQTYIKDIYEQLYEDLKTGNEGGEEQAGFIFEKMITGLLTKISVDLGDQWKFNVANASVIDDVELKTDLIVQFLDSKTQQGNRGVGAGENEHVTGSKGFQLTLISKNDKKWQHKKDQVRKVKEQIMRGEVEDIDDLVLLETEVGNKQVMSRFDQWNDRGRFAGGPEKLFSSVQIMEFLSKIFEDTELDFKTNAEFEYALNQYFEKYG